MLQSYPGERAEIKGRILISEGADYLMVKDLDFDGSGGPKSSEGFTLPSLTVNANNTRWCGNNVTNHHTGICFLVGDDDYGTATGTVVRDNHIHNCGRLPRTNHDHGIYVNSARNTKVIGNRIYDNAARGIQIYLDAQRTS